MDTCSDTRKTTHATVVDLLRQRALAGPGTRAYTFLADGEHTELCLSLGELDRQARAIAAALREAGVGREPVLLVFPAGLAFLAAFFGCMYAGAIAVNVAPPRPKRSWHRFGVIARDSGARVALTQDAIRARVELQLGEHDGPMPLTWISTDRIATDSAPPWVDPSIDAESLAVLQYTSGSTASPRGTMVTHGNVLHNLRFIAEAFGHTDQSVGLGWLPHTHDMGLFGNLLYPLYVGFPWVFMAPEHFLVKPVRWLSAISRYGATTSGGPNFAYDLCVDKTTPEQRRSLDLSRWSVACSGAEPVRANTLDRFTAAFGASGFRREAFYPCYGLAESTLMVTGGRKSVAPVTRTFNIEALKANRVVVEDCEGAAGRTMVGCGSPPTPRSVVIANPDTHRAQPDGHVGEIWASSPSVARGYWRQPDVTADLFQAHVRETGDGPYLRTGDLGFIHEGTLFISGRLRDLIIIGGANHFPVDIEQTVESCHPAIHANGVAAFGDDADGHERLVVAVELERGYARRSTDDPVHVVQQVETAIREAVAHNHGLATHAIRLVRQWSLPRTPSGKLQRHLCREQFVCGQLTLATPAMDPS
jgi:acyl-CoA synthetase (AMP-forming)/AMP-acid ligase II